MRGRSSTGGKALKAGRKATSPKRPNAPKAALPHKSRAAGEETEVARLRRELNEALEQQAATSEVLSVINSSPGDLKTVFEAMLESAVRLCEAKFGFMTRYDGDAFHLMAQHGAAPAYIKIVSRGPLRLGPETILGQVLSRKQAVQIPDMAATRGYAERNPLMVAAVELGGVRTYLAVPMFKENRIIGVVLLYRQEVRPFNDKQVALLTSFAAQAVIAIENTRLLNELHQRTDDLSEALERQTATSEVLKVISISPGELQPVFQTMLENAVQICGAKFGNMYLRKGDALHLVAAHNTPPALIEERAGTVYRVDENKTFVRMMRTKDVVHVTDITSHESYLGNPRAVAAAELGGVRTNVFVPLIKESKVVGYFSIFAKKSDRLPKNKSNC